MEKSWQMISKALVGLASVGRCADTVSETWVLAEDWVWVPRKMPLFLKLCYSCPLLSTPKA